MSNTKKGTWMGYVGNDWDGEIGISEAQYERDVLLAAIADASEERNELLGPITDKLDEIVSCLENIGHALAESNVIARTKN